MADFYEFCMSVCRGHDPGSFYFGCAHGFQSWNGCQAAGLYLDVAMHDLV